MTIALTLTTAGLAALVNATHTGIRASAIAAIGVSPHPLAATPDMTALPGELKRITAIGGSVVDPQTIHIAMEDASADAYTLRSF
ncbi:hypothetical protein ACE4ZU_26310, partial [Salmonella enterica]|uniref:hypothetical protein n=1 Tax=Salmonella enterica TaxID=28901 RepID=UPI003D2C8F3B